MKLSKVVLENFKKHKYLEIDFDPNHTLIVGANYQGKSSVMQAVLFALFGTSAVHGASTDLVHTGQTNLKVSLSLSTGHTIVRSLKNCTVGMGVEESGVLARSHSACNLLIEEILGISKKQFLLNYYSKQGSAQALLDMDGAELVRHVEDCIGMDKLQRVLKECNQVASSNKSKVEALSDYLLSEDQVKSLTLQEDQLKTSILSAKESKAVTEKLKEQEEIEYKQLLGNQEEKSSSYKEWVSHRSLLEAAEEVLIKHPKPAIPSEELLKLQGQAKAYEDYEVASTRINERLDTEKERRAKLEAVSLESVDTQAAEESLSQQKIFINNMESELSILNRKIKDSSCPTCKRPFEDDFDKADAEFEFEQMTKTLASLIADKENLVSELAILRRKEKEYQNHSSSLLRATEKLDELKVQVQELESLNVDEPKDSRSSKELFEQFRAVQKIETLRQSASEVCLKQPPEHPEVTQEEVTSLQETVKQASNKVRELSETVSELSASLKTQERDSSDIQEKITFHNNTKDKIEGHAKDADNFAKITTILQEVRKEAADSAWVRVMGLCSIFVKGATGGDVERVYLTEKGITYEEQGYSRSVAACASGAQKTLIGIGLKMGLSAIAPSPVKFLLLDEPTADMSDQISSACMRLIGQYSDQVVAVTHRNMDTADSVITL